MHRIVHKSYACPLKQAVVLRQSYHISARGVLKIPSMQYDTIVTAVSVTSTPMAMRETPSLECNLWSASNFEARSVCSIQNGVSLAS